MKGLTRLGFIFCCLTFTLAAQAEEMGLQTWGAFVKANPEAIGGEFGFGALWEPIPTHHLAVGPRVSVLALSWDPGSRTDLNLGVEGTLWFVNAVGPGLGIDFIAPLHGDSNGGHFRFEPYFALRLKHLGDTGALGTRIGALYDTRYLWGGFFALTLQWSGIPSPFSGD